MIAAPVFAQSADSAVADGAAPIEQAAMRLGNNQYIWRASDDVESNFGDVEIVISLPMQRLFVYRGGTLIGASSVSTGRPSKRTPAGEFTILQKARYHRSNIYSNAPMPFMQRLTWSGIAMHAGYLPGYPASHGCIRMPAAFARRLYTMTKVGVPVLVTNQRLPDTTPPPMPADAPILMADASEYESERFAIVTAGSKTFSAPGAVVFGPSRPVVQPTPYGRNR